MMKYTTQLGLVALLLLLGLIWGSGFALAKFATTNGVSPLGYSYWQSIGPAVVLVLLSKIRLKSFALSISNIRFYLTCGLIGIALPNSIMYLAAPHLPSGLIGVIANTVPLLTYPLALFAKQEYFNLTRLLGLVIGIVGLYLIVGMNATLPTNESLPFALLLLITPLSFAVCAIYIHHNAPKGVEPLTLSAGMLFSSALLLSPIMLLTNQFYPITTPFSLPDWIILLEILLSSVGYVIFFVLLKKAGPVYYSLVGGVVSLTGLLWGYILHQEALTFVTTIAVLLILTAITLVSIKQHQSMEAI